MNNENASKKDNILKTLHKKIINAGSDFHVYNYILPAILPILGLIVCMFCNTSNEIDWKTFFLSSYSQLLYFSFFILISNTVILHNKTNTKANSIHLVAALIILFIYIGYSSNLYNKNHIFKNWEICIWTIIVITILYLVIGIYAMNPNSPYNNNEEDITTEISVNKANQENKTDEELN